jgi:hypothetical protein
VSTNNRGQKRLARKLEEYRTDFGVPVKVYVKKANPDEPLAGNGSMLIYFRCLVGDVWVTYVVIFTEGLRAVLSAKRTREESAMQVALRYVKGEIARGNLVDGTEIEFGPLQERLFPAQ